MDSKRDLLVGLAHSLASSLGDVSKGTVNDALAEVERLKQLENELHHTLSAWRPIRWDDHYYGEGFERVPVGKDAPRCHTLRIRRNSGEWEIFEGEHVFGKFKHADRDTVMMVADLMARLKGFRMVDEPDAPMKVPAKLNQECDRAELAYDYRDHRLLSAEPAGITVLCRR